MLQTLILQQSQTNYQKQGTSGQSSKAFGLVTSTEQLQETNTGCITRWREDLNFMLEWQEQYHEQEKKRKRNRAKIRNYIFFLGASV